MLKTIPVCICMYTYIYIYVQYILLLHIGPLANLEAHGTGSRHYCQVAWIALTIFGERLHGSTTFTLMYIIIESNDGTASTPRDESLSFYWSHTHTQIQRL